MDSSGEYVKFSKEGFWLEVPPEKLRKELEEELKLSGCNLKSNAWYHGCIPWEVSESLMVQHGDFLIRDSLSKPGGYVLTCHWNNITLHFPIIKAFVQSSETSSCMQFTLEGEAFDSIQSLVHFYVGNQTDLTQQGGAQIHNPVNRTLPLRYLEENFDLARSKCCVVSSPSCQKGKGAKTAFERDENHPASPSTNQLKKEVRNHDLVLKKNHPLTPVRDSSISPSNNTTSPPRSPCYSRVDRVASFTFLSRHANGTLRQPCCENSYLQQTKGTEAPDPGIGQGKEEHGEMLCAPVVERVSIFRPNIYQSILMPKENKPLEVGILQRVKKQLAEVDIRTAAEHITKADCMVVVARILDANPEMQKMMGVNSGMELLTLPHGSQLRLDLLERFQTMAFMLAVDILGCTGTSEERADMLNKYIQIAAVLRISLGNMFGFATIMTALDLPQISRLGQTWMMLRQRHTASAILYEKTLKPFMKRLNDGKESYPLSNTSFPHVVPLLCLLEKNFAVSEAMEPWETVEAGVDVVMRHLGLARSITRLGGIYCFNAKTKLHGFVEQPEVLEIFLTDFQMRLLWGSKGAGEIQDQRYDKFEQVLTILSNKLEPSGRPQQLSNSIPNVNLMPQ